MSTGSCPLCRRATAKVIYLGAPGWICLDPACSCAGGLAATLMGWFDWLEDGGWTLTVYEGGYLKGLWLWLTGAPKEMR